MTTPLSTAWLPPQTSRQCIVWGSHVVVADMIAPELSSVPTAQGPVWHLNWPPTPSGVAFLGARACPQLRTDADAPLSPRVDSAQPQDEAAVVRLAVGGDWPLGIHRVDPQRRLVPIDLIT